MRSSIVGLSATVSLFAVLFLALPGIAAPPQPQCKAPRCSTWTCASSGMEARSCNIFLMKGGKCVHAKTAAESRPAIRCTGKPKTLPKAPIKALN